MKLVIDHLTRYGYDEEVKFSTQYLRLTPRSSGRQKITARTLTLPDGSAVATTDAWGNVLHVLTLDNPHKEITIRASGSSISPKRGRHRRGAAGAAVAAGFLALYAAHPR